MQVKIGFTYNTFRKISLFLCGCMVMFLCSCDNISENALDEVPATLSNRFPVIFSINSASERTVLPSDIEEEDLSFILSAEPEDSKLSAISMDENLINDKLKDGIKYATIEKLNAACLYLDAGVWKFSLKAYKNPDYQEANFADGYEEKYKVLMSDIQPVTVGPDPDNPDTPYDNNTAVVFLMKAAEKGSGSIELNLKCYLGGEKSSSKIDYVQGQLEPLSEVSDTIPVGTADIAGADEVDNNGDKYRLVTYTNSDVPKGTYLLTCVFTLTYDDDSNSDTAEATIESYYSTVVTVEPGAVSKGEEDVRKLKQRYTITYYVDSDTNFNECDYWVDRSKIKFYYNPSSDEDVILPKITDIKRPDKCFVGWYAKKDYSGDPVTSVNEKDGKKEFYAKWRDLKLYVSQNGATHNDGTETSPYATLKKAIDFIEDYGGSELNWQIYISGSVSGHTGISSDVVAKSITISGKNPAEDKLVLSTTANDSVISINSDAPVVIEKLTVSGGKGTSGAGLNIGAYAEVTMHTVIVTENDTGTGTDTSTNLNGGGILNAGRLSLENCTITKNKAFSDGGGIWNKGALTLKDCTVTENISSNSGGGIYNQGGTVYIFGGTVIGGEDNGNVAVVSGGGIANDSSGTLYIGYKAPAEGNAPVEEDFTGSISYNKVSETAGTGGGVYNQGTFIMKGGEIAHNIAKEGTGVYNTTGTNSANTGICKLSGVTVSNNDASNGNGGGIWSNGTLTVAEGVFKNNTAAAENVGNGGAVYIDSNTATANISGTFLENIASASGGAVYSSSALTVTDTSTFTGNKVTVGSGGAIYAEGSVTANAAITMTENKAERGSGGAIYATGDITIPALSVISSNIALTAGGGIYAGGTVILSDSAVTKNKVTAEEATGGGIYIGGANSTLVSSEITENKAENGSGGGIYIAEGASATLTGMTIGAENSPNTSVVGGGVYNAGALTVIGGTIVHNIATASGAAAGAGIYSNGTLDIKGNAVVSNNKAENGWGGGVYNAGTFTVQAEEDNSPSISANAAANGAGVYTAGENALFTMSAGTIGGNKASTNGGGVYNAAAMYMYGDAVIGNAEATSVATFNDDDGEVTEITASNAASESGGGIYNKGSLYVGYSSSTSTRDFSGGVYYNYAKNGAGIYSASGALYINSGTVTYNVAFNNGGGIYNGDIFNFSGGYINNNKADSGGGVYNDGAMDMTGNAFIGVVPEEVTSLATSNSHSNYAVLSGGGIYNNTAKTLNLGTDANPLTGGIYYNYAGKGGGIYNGATKALCVIKSGTIGQNGAGQKAGISGGADTSSGNASIQN